MAVAAALRSHCRRLLRPPGAPALGRPRLRPWPSRGVASGLEVERPSELEVKDSTPYEALGVLHTATAEEVREAYLRLVKQYHPDQAQGQGTDYQKEAADRFAEIQAAWYVLGDAKRRREFDEFGSLAAAPASWSPMMWARVRKPKPEEGALMPNWGSEEPPLWLIVFTPVSIAFLVTLYSARYDIIDNFKDQRALRAGGWPCPKCVVVNPVDATECYICKGARPKAEE